MEFESNTNATTTTPKTDEDAATHDENIIVTSEPSTPTSSSTKSEGSGVLVEKEDVDVMDSNAQNEDDKNNINNDEIISNTIDDAMKSNSNDDDAIVSANDETPTSTSYDNNKDSNDHLSNNTDTDKQTESQPSTIKQQQITCFIHPSTPIPNSDSALRILRKFILKTSSFFPISMGGTKAPSILSYIFGGGNKAGGVDVTKDECCLVYKELTDALSNDNDDDDDNHNNEYGVNVDDNDNNDEVMIESILGHSGDTMSKARKSMAAFCRLIETWCLETQRVRLVEMEDDLAQYVTQLEKSYFYNLRQLSLLSSNHPMEEDYEDYRREKIESMMHSTNSIITSEILSIALSSAEALVAHGCLDSVMIGVGEEQNPSSSALDLSIMPSITEDDNEDNDDNEEDKEGAVDHSFEIASKEPEYVNAITVLADSVFVCYLDSEAVELAGLKFLLTTGCRTIKNMESGYDEAMLRGSRLLQTIRVCYRVYLSTQSEANKTTARAALRQIVISTFKRLEIKNHDSTNDKAIETIKGNDDPFSTPVLDENEQQLNNWNNSHDDQSTSGMSYGANFSTFEHKDAYLVLRSLCKLSMKASVGGAFQNVVVIRDESLRSNETRNTNMDIPKQEILMDPALDSKILALDLLVEILQATKTELLLNAGPQLIYAVRNYLCHSLLKNCTSSNNYVVSLSLRLFVPLIRHFRSHLKTEIEAFVTNVFFVILDSKNSTVEHKLRVVILFEEICSDPATLAEIFLNYDCDLSAVDLFQRIVNTLAKVAKIGLHDHGMNTGGIFVAGAGVSRAEKSRQEHRELRLEAMKAVKQVLASLHESFVSPDIHTSYCIGGSKIASDSQLDQDSNHDSTSGPEKQSLVQIYDSKRKRREEAAKATLKFNQKPSAGIKFAAEAGLINGDDPADVAQFLLTNKEVLDKTQIGDYLGREPEYQDGFALKVLHQYLNLFDFTGLLFDDAIKFYLSGFRLPGEAQKIDRIMEKFAERYTIQNPDVFPTADAAFILAFSIIMLNTDLHNPAIKEERRMTKEGFLRNNSGICDGKDLPAEFLTDIFDRIKSDPISLKEDDELREKASKTKNGTLNKSTNSGIFTNTFSEIDRRRETDYQKERDQILRNTESLLRRKKKKGSESSASSKELGIFVSTETSGLKYEYVIPMFDVTWAPALAVFSTVIESANGTMGTLLSIATDREIESAAENAASATEICLSGFRLAIKIAALCGNDTARSAYVHALSNFSLLGTGRLLEHRHIRCVQTLLEVARDDGELLGNSWEYIFKALSEVARLNQVFEATSRASRVSASGIDRTLKRTKEKDYADIDGRADDLDANPSMEEDLEKFDSIDKHDFELEEEMDKKAIDETNARMINDNIPSDISDAIYMRAGSLSVAAIKDFIFQLCRVSRMEIAGYGGHVGNKANAVDLTAVHYRKHHTLLTNIGDDPAGRHNQPDIYSLQKLVEVTHYNMDSRPRLIFADIWGIVSSHLTSTSLHENAAVAIYAVDSFRQLSIQFLQREELGVFEFQRKFLKPLEAVMSKCQNVSVKEFLLKAIEQIILLFEADDGMKVTGDEVENKRVNSIRSGWRPILTVIGISSQDKDDSIADLGFTMLTKQLRKSLQLSTNLDNVTSFSSKVVLRADKFVDLVDALLMFISGPREDKSSLSIDHLVTMARYLADQSVPLPHSFTTNVSGDDNKICDTVDESSTHNSEELELWWPLLLGLSRTVGDVRPNIRIKGLVSLLAIINQHFFSSMVNNQSTVLGDLQTLQLIFKGILTPALEHAETNVDMSTNTIPLPDGFIRFITKGSPAHEAGGRKSRIENNSVAKGNNWIDTTFDHLIDGSISLALKSLEVYKDDILIEEVLSMFNNCLVSDSPILVTRGMKRLLHFVTSDLSREVATENTWATISHMLRRCLSVRGLPFEYGSLTEDEENSVIREFLQEEQIFPARRYIGSNVAMIIGTILCDKQIVERMGLRWYLFLLSGLGTGIKCWDKAAFILDSYPTISNLSDDASPPQYAENALYARKWLVRILAPKIGNGEFNSIPQIKGIMKDEFDSLVSVYLKKETQEAANASPGLVLEMEHMSKMICDLLEAFCLVSDSDIPEIASLTPTLSACVQINDKTIRTAVHGLLQKIFQGGTKI